MDEKGQVEKLTKHNFGLWRIFLKKLGVDMRAIRDEEGTNENLVENRAFDETEESVDKGKSSDGNFRYSCRKCSGRTKIHNK